MRVLKLEGVMNRLYNENHESLLASSQQVYCLAIFDVSSVIFIKASDKLFEGGIMVLIVFVGGLIVPLLIQYQESTRLGQVSEASKMILEKSKELSRRRTVLHKFLAGCRVLHLGLGYPFYNIGKHTFLEFIDEAANFIFTVLAF